MCDRFSGDKLCIPFAGPSHYLCLVFHYKTIQHYFLSFYYFHIVKKAHAYLSVCLFLRTNFPEELGRKSKISQCLYCQKSMATIKLRNYQPHSSVEKMHEYKEQRKTTTEIIAAITAVFVASGML